jgi:DAK2 domain fusion protein YloV
VVINTIDANMLKKMFLAGAKSLEIKKEWINELNVFPVPDGDTGTNMTLTIMSAVKEVNNVEDITVENVARAIATGSLRGARGNSGVILSQLFRGFSKGIIEHKELDSVVLANAFEKGVATAYKAVMKPKEGTILTVARGIAEKAVEIAAECDDLTKFLEIVFAEGERVLASTPDLLPVLKEAGVVDSGGQGLLEILRGAVDIFMGKEVDLSFEMPETNIKSGTLNTDASSDADIEFGYCTEFIINLGDKKFAVSDEDKFKAFLSDKGDSVVCVADDDLVKIHVHTNNPGDVLQMALSYGELSQIKIDNMREEHQEKLIKDAERQANEIQPAKEYGFISVSIGEGIGEIFKGLGVDYLIEGGQTMNPSTEDMLNAIEKVNAKTTYIFPNNKNIILAANQAQALVTDKKVIVIPTTTIPQGITAIINFVPEKSDVDNEAAMLDNIARVKTGQVTYAVRDTEIDKKPIKKGDIMGLGDNGLIAVGSDVITIAKETIAAMIDDEAELISIYYGEDMTAADSEQLGAEVEALYPECDIEINFGGQPIYYCIVSVE